jgi:uncharacterized pyridoxal phosphate-containing UPF0001 family protein
MPFADMVAREGITLHMIGSLQRNKARDAVVLFDWVQSVDRPHLAKALEKAAEAERAGMEPLPVLLQVNITGEASKSGVVATDLPGLAETVAACPHLKCEGLMTIARLGASEAELRETFASLRTPPEHGHERRLRNSNRRRRDDGPPWKSPVWSARTIRSIAYCWLASSRARANSSKPLGRYAARSHVLPV